MKLYAFTVNAEEPVSFPEYHLVLDGGTDTFVLPVPDMESFRQTLRDAGVEVVGVTLLDDANH